MPEDTENSVKLTGSGFEFRRSRGEPQADSGVSNSSLTSAGFDIVETYELAATPQTEGRRSATTQAFIGMDVPIATGQAAVLLLEGEDGILSWRFPDRTALPSGRRGAGSGIARFSVAPKDPATLPPERRSYVTDWLLDAVTKPVRIRVLRFLARRTVDAAVSHIEAGMVTGPVVVEGQDPLAWRRYGVQAARDRLTSGKPSHVLLLVHGTFSSTAGSFGGLAGSGILDGYDLVIGFDHRTLGDDPIANAEGILSALHELDLPAGSRIDAIAYSRGGLVYRALVERLGAAARLGVAFEKAVFVGCTNAGTLLAEPDNWKALLDLYTNLLVVGARIGMGLAGAGAAQPLVTAAIRTMGGFAQLLSQVAITERRVPGLAAMEPDGELVTALNGAPRAAGFVTKYYTIETDYRSGNAADGLARKAAMSALDRIADRLYGVENDLVVPTASMRDFGVERSASGFLAIPSDSGVYHTTYFADERVAAQIGTWLGRQAGGTRRQRGQPAASPRFEVGIPQTIDPDVRFAERRPSQEGRQGPAGIDWGTPHPPSAPQIDVGATEFFPSDRGHSTWPPSSGHSFGLDHEPEPAASGGAVPGGTKAEPLESASEPSTGLTERYLAAEMAPHPRLGPPANVYVTVSPDALVVADHAAAAALEKPVELIEAKALTLEIIPQLNCEVVGAASAEVDLRDRDEVVIKFKVRGLAAGSAQVRVEARQGSAAVASFLLEPVFVAANPAPLRANAALSVAATPTKGKAVLRIYEFRGGDSGLRLQFNLTSDDPEFAELDSTEIANGFSLEGYAGDVLAQVESAWNLRQLDDDDTIYRSFLTRLTNDAKLRTDALVPLSIRSRLWKHRKELGAIQVISSEPHIPWELMYLADPSNDETDGEGFFAEWGLTRWLHDAPLSRKRIAFGDGPQRQVIPEYADGDALAGAQQEGDMLKDLFPAIEPIEPTSLAVGEFLKNGAAGCALLHFACHGRTQQNSSIASELLMRSQTKASGETVQDVLTWQDVAASADFGIDGGPLVFVNACQTGRQGTGIAGAAGFASAFLRPRSRRGAAAFIGALWSIDDKLASDFARTVYQGLDEGKPLSEAVRAAREVCKTRNDFTWLAYSVYGRD